MTRKQIALQSIVLLFMGGTAAQANVSFSYTDFSSLAGIQTNGDAAQAGSVLRLVPSADTKSGTAYYMTPITLNATSAFSTSFEFMVTSGATSAGPADGFTFLMQNDAAGVNAVGAGGQGLGYVGLSPSVATVFRGRAPSFIGVITGGTDPANLSDPFNPPGATSLPEGSFYGPAEFAWIDYNPTGTILSVYLSSTNVKPGTAIMTTNAVDVFGTLGSQAYVGFSAGNGAGFANQDILNWNFAETPEPGFYGLVGLGLTGLAFVRRLRKKQSNS